MPERLAPYDACKVSDNSFAAVDFDGGGQNESVAAEFSRIRGRDWFCRSVATCYTSRRKATQDRVAARKTMQLVMNLPDECLHNFLPG
ncbi:MAG: hypothetical protein DWI00_02720, partial [Planctomycetota bacterium]